MNSILFRTRLFLLFDELVACNLSLKLQLTADKTCRALLLRFPL